MLVGQINDQAALSGVLNTLYDDERGVLYRDWRAGERGVPAFSEDYAGVAEGLLALYRVTGDKHWLKRAVALVDGMLQQFWDEDDGGFFSTASDTELWIRKKEIGDGASVNANFVSVVALGETDLPYQFTANAESSAEGLGGNIPMSQIILGVGHLRQVVRQEKFQVIE